MLKVRSELDFLEKPFRPKHGGELRRQNFYRHPSMMPDVLGQIYSGHSSRTDLAFDAIPVTKRSRKPLRGGQGGVIVAGLRLLQCVTGDWPAPARMKSESTGFKHMM